MVLILGNILKTLSYKRDIDTRKIFQVKIDHNAKLILVWPHLHFQQNVKVSFCQQYWC